MDNGKVSQELHTGFSGASVEVPVTSLKWRPNDSGTMTMNMLVTVHADGTIRHWHVTSGKCVHQRQDDPENQLYTCDYNHDGTHLATAGRDLKIRIYDESTKSVAYTLKDSDSLPGHSNRIFCVKFDPWDKNIIYSGGWDNSLCIYDLRKGGPVAQMYGPHVCGEAIDARRDGKLITGSYRVEDALQLWDLKMNKVCSVLNWNGGWEDPKTEADLKKIMHEGPPSPKSKKKEVPVPFIYSACFSKPDQSLIVAGGAGRNEVRLWEYESGNLICNISDLEQSILTVDFANQSQRFAFGATDSCLRVMDIVDSHSGDHHVESSE